MKMTMNVGSEMEWLATDHFVMSKETTTESAHKVVYAMHLFISLLTTEAINRYQQPILIGAQDQEVVSWSGVDL